jgi:hypothetical protein
MKYCSNCDRKFKRIPEANSWQTRLICKCGEEVLETYGDFGAPDTYEYVKHGKKCTNIIDLFEALIERIAKLL